MEWRAGYMKYHNEALSSGDGIDSATQVGIPGVNIDRFSSGISRITIENGFTDPAVGFAVSMPWDRGETTVNLVGMLTKITGNHTIKVGTEIRHNKDYLLQIQNAGGVRGQFKFNGASTSIPGDSAATSGIANAFASFLLDEPYQVQRDIKVIDQPGTQNWAVFAFAQDKWQVTSKLTVDLGLRWEYYTPFVGIADKGGLSNYNPDNNTVEVAGYGNIPQDVGVEKNFKNFAPRLGVSYRLRRQDGAARRLRDDDRPVPGQPLRLQLPGQAERAVQRAEQLHLGGLDGERVRRAHHLPGPGERRHRRERPAAQERTALVRAARPQGGEAPHAGTSPCSASCRGSLVGEVAYVGNVGRGIVIPDYDLNAGLKLGAENNGRPYYQKYGRTASILSFLPTNTSYNSLQAKLDRRFRNGLMVTTSYTLGKAIDYTEETGIGTPANLELSKGRPNYDRKHVFAASFIYDVPFFREGNGVLHWVLGGWQFSGIFTAYSGTPITFTASNATLRAPGNTQRPNVSGTPEVYGDIGPGQKYFDTSVFSAPAQDTWGNMKRDDSIDGPGFWNLDASLVKRFWIGRRVSFELRADAFNLTNTPHFNNPNGAFGSATFGEINSSFGQRLVRFGARLQF